ncbi:MAG: 3-isopropylmalate dehydratase small subunit [Lentisphaerae bacterium]|jgi:3-isopropylmalate/(R)-2-methylmalate dehydratase small subunit|nr:3-isopropylmalate dehydratase small subunit [Lentisphaerota bacterium]
MTPFTQHTGIVATLERANVDTDAIIPKQYLKSIKRTGFEAGLFSDWRYLSDGSDDPDFELNRAEFKGASILLTRHNFGCGSSREHAVWAVCQYGFRVIIAPYAGSGEERVPAFADIFRGNSIRNGLLCIELEPQTVESLFKAVAQSPGVEAKVDLEAQTITLPAVEGRVIKFEIEPGVRSILLQGLDDIATTLTSEADINNFEERHNNQLSGCCRGF